MKKISLIVITMLFGITAMAQSIEVESVDHSVQDIAYNNRTFNNKGVKLNSGELLVYGRISKISTKDFNAYEEATKRAGKKYNEHIKVDYTGEGNVHALRLDKLKKKRGGADVARTAGGIMTILGVLSGDRGLTAAGLATNGAGRIARNINDDRTMDTQTEMLKDLDKRSKEAEALSEEETLFTDYGRENVEGLDALIKRDADRALALANVGELSDNEDHQLSSIWLKAMIATDQGQKENRDKELERLVSQDATIDNVAEAQKEVGLLMVELEKLRA